MIRHDETARLNSLRNLRLLDTIPSESFDRITRLVAQFFNLPIAAVSLTDHDRQWFKSKVGVTHNQIPRERAPCAEVAETGRNLVIRDFVRDEFYCDSVLGKSGIRFYAGAPLLTPDGHGIGALCVLGTEPRQVTEQEMATLADLAAMVMDQVELQHAVGRIEVTSGLPNRIQMINDLTDLAQGDHTPRIAGLLDLAQTAQFDRVSRVVGAGYLDRVIKRVTAILADHVGPHGMAYHIGPTQFVFFAPFASDTAAYVTEVRNALQNLQQQPDFRMTMTPAIGVMRFVPGETAPEDVLRCLQSAVQDARETDTGVAIFCAAAHRRHQRHFQILEDFPAALESHEQLSLVFQPRMTFVTGEIESAEALLRWTHPTLGAISPAEFIPIVEASCYARHLTAWVIEHAVRHLHQWNRLGIRLRLSINLSAFNLQEPDLFDRLFLLLRKFGVEAGQIEFELTETAMMKETERALDLLHRLTQAGIRLAIDDFGTGYSSLAYMQKLPADVVKIDRCFIKPMIKGEREQVLVRSMIDLAHSLGYQVVAEGVESVELRDVLQAQGCDELQGYWLAKPMPGRELLDWLTRYDLERDIPLVRAG
ncbi:sensor domain-containing phosphodiesterase [Rhizobium oryzicola]|uniref:GGDEF and EAL domain-containing protein n=1 Tax=Rhizobium oryzicola TaxID=1232668 RepID=A0ABT8SZG2_9HYPH|nr:GGDEF and EAL domain-containing protein [Rhizobium oryzicola]MDO1583027.1 GGDEF and EAL domain-containing protein [Rhizobium oryzicola]